MGSPAIRKKDATVIITYKLQNKNNLIRLTKIIYFFFNLPTSKKTAQAAGYIRTYTFYSKIMQETINKKFVILMTSKIQ